MSEVVPTSPRRTEVEEILAGFPIGDVVRFEDGEAIITGHRLSRDLTMLRILLRMQTGPRTGCCRSLDLPLA